MKKRSMPVWVELNAGLGTAARGLSAEHANDGSVFTAGIGISPFNVVHLDMTGMAGTDRTYGAATQLTFTF
jgi:hypothetical protein